MVDVFISYSRTDKEKVAHLARAIEAEGYQVWWDAELPPHQSYGEVITAKIESAKAALVVWSPEAAASEWVRAEADSARNQKKLIQTALADIIPPLPFNQIQCANLADWTGEADHPGWSKVKVSLAALCGERSAAAAPDTAAPAAPAFAMSAPPQSQPQSPPQPSKTTPMWPVFAGVGVAALGLIGAAWMMFGGQTGAGGVAADAAQSGNGSAETVITTPEEIDGALAFAGNGSGEINAAPPNTDLPDSFDAGPAITAAPDYGAQPMPAGDELNRNITIINKTGQPILYLYWSNDQQENWGMDQLGENQIIETGAQVPALVDDGTGACIFDFKARLMDGREVEQRGINVCGVWEISFS